MKENELSAHFQNHPLLSGLIEAISEDKIRNIRMEGLSGSSKAMFLALVFHETQTTHVVIVPEKEDAAYFYNDLSSLLGDDSVFFFNSESVANDIGITNKQARATIYFMNSILGRNF